MSSDDPKSLEGFILELADASGAAIMPFFRSDLDVDDKRTRGAFDPVTEGDKAGERAIRALVDSRFPDHGILGEEYGFKAGASPVSWVIDPIDGTRVFMSGLPTWGTLIGAMENNIPVVGLMDQPYTGERFVGGPSGAFLIGPRGRRPMACRGCASLDDAVMGATDPRMFAKGKEADAFATLADRVKLLRYGGDCYNYAMVALGQMDLVVEAGNQAYDILPLVPVIEAAGGMVSDWQGRPLRGGDDFARSGGRMIASGDTRVHEQALEVLSGAAD
jgi:myo-inositol-1(or 4)-monophosphatase